MAIRKGVVVEWQQCSGVLTVCHRQEFCDKKYDNDDDKVSHAKK